MAGFFYDFAVHGVAGDSPDTERALPLEKTTTVNTSTAAATISEPPATIGSNAGLPSTIRYRAGSITTNPTVMDHRNFPGCLCRVKRVVPAEYCTRDPSEQVDVRMGRKGTMIARDGHLQARADPQYKPQNSRLKK
jgi:hypothetical protein